LPYETELLPTHEQQRQQQQQLTGRTLSKLGLVDSTNPTARNALASAEEKIRLIVRERRKERATFSDNRLQLVHGIFGVRSFRAYFEGIKKSPQCHLN
jgi:hypothetical protein